MNCQEIREQLDAALDDQRVISSQADGSQYAEIVSHAESCDDCRVLYEEHLLIGSALAKWASRRPTVDLTDRVIAAVRQEGLISSNDSAVIMDAGCDELQRGLLGSEQSPYVLAAPGPSDDTPVFIRRRSTTLAAITTTVLVLFAAFIVFREGWQQMAKDERSTQQVFPDEQPKLLDGPENQLADISHLVADAQSAWQGITSRVSHQASGFGVFVPDLKSELGISDESELFEPDSEPDKPGGEVKPHEPAEPSAVEKAFEFLFDNESAGTLTI